MSPSDLVSLSLVLSLVIACGGGGGGAAPDAGPADPGCGFEGDRFLPYQPGYLWEYRVTELGTGEITTKSQTVMSGTDGDYLQVTVSPSGRTESSLRREGDALVRLSQVDYDARGRQERTTRYEPHKIRLDEGMWLATPDEPLAERYTATVTDDAGEVNAIEVEERWTVIAANAPCDTPFGPARCLHVRRLRTKGGSVNKEYWFARGIGKVREQGGQVEVLTGCRVE